MKIEKDTKLVIPNLRFPQFRGKNGWQPKAINQLCKIGNGKDYKHLNHGDIPVYGSGGYMASVDDYLYDGESVCIGRKGTIDKPMYLNGKFWTVDTLFFTYSFCDCLPKFLYFIFQKINWLKYNEASGVPSLSKKAIGRIEIYIPKDNKEQEKIAGCLSSLDTLIESTSRKIEALKVHKKGLMQLLFPKEGKLIPEKRFPKFERMKEWRESYISQECPISYSGGTPKTTDSKYYNGDIPFIRSAEIGKENTELFITDTGLKDSSAKLINKGDILIALYGANSGDVALAKIDGAINQAILCLKAKNSNSFIYYSLLHKKKYIISTFLQGGQGNLSGEIIKSLTLYLPEPKEQNKIADCISSIDCLIQKMNNQLDILKKYKIGLMQQLFPKL